MSKQQRQDRKKRKASERNKRQAEYKSNRPHRCGECRACCYHFPLLDKPKKQWCKHSTPTGCGCYNDRPPICRQYQCGWLLWNTLPNYLRPDRSGIIITRRFTFKGHLVVFLSELRPGALSTTIADELIANLKRGKIIIATTEQEGIGFCCSHVGISEEQVQELFDAFHADCTTENQLHIDDNSHFNFAG
jgi:hypothetical protein